jgi:membrane-bound inhibitor of C-type lysozyme
MRKLLFIAVAAAFAGPAMAEDATVNWTCGDLAVAATYMQADNTLNLKIGDKEYKALPNVESGSGAKYEMGEGADYIMMWDSGDNALLQVGETEYPECTKAAM